MLVLNTAQELAETGPRAQRGYHNAGIVFAGLYGPHSSIIRTVQLLRNGLKRRFLTKQDQPPSNAILLWR
jgi:hypothetical protein